MMNSLTKFVAVTVLCCTLITAFTGRSVSADSAYYPLVMGSPLLQDWTNTGLISANDNWSSVPSFTGYRGDDGTVSATDIDARTILADYSSIVDVQADQSLPNTLVTPGVAEFQIADPTVALSANGASDFPNLDLRLNTTNCAAPSSVRVTYNLRDLDGSADNAAQQIALQYRVGASGSYSNAPGGYVADATLGSSATLVTPVDLILPATVLGQSQVHLRWITTNAAGNDEWVGIDDIAVTCTLTTAAAVSVSGRITDANGRSISGAMVTVVGGDMLTPKYSSSNTFGYYRVDGLQAGQSYFVSVLSRRYRFDVASQLVSLEDSVTDLDFVAARR